MKLKPRFDIIIRQGKKVYYGDIKTSTTINKYQVENYRRLMKDDPR